MKILVFGLGNPILGDDGIGIHIVEKLREVINSRLSQIITIETSSVGGMDLAESVLGYDYAIIVDAILDPSIPPGHVIVKDINNYQKAIHLSNPHDINFVTALEVLKQLYPDLIPERVFLVGISISERNLTFSDKISPYLESSVERVHGILLKLIESLLEGKCFVKVSS